MGIIKSIRVVMKRSSQEHIASIFRVEEKAKKENKSRQ
jgi:hypothetical protein